MAFASRQLVGQLVGKPVIIMVDQRYEGPSRFPYAMIPAERDSRVGLIEDSDWLSETASDGAGCIGRAIVDDDYFNVAGGLPKDASYRFLKVKDAVVCWNND